MLITFSTLFFRRVRVQSDVRFVPLLQAHLCALHLHGMAEHVRQAPQHRPLPRARNAAPGRHPGRPRLPPLRGAHGDRDARLPQQHELEDRRRLLASPLRSAVDSSALKTPPRDCRLN